MKKQPFKHQETFLHWVRGRKSVPLFSDQGTGKTWMALAWLERLTHVKGDFLVICETAFIDEWLEGVEYLSNFEAVGLKGVLSKRIKLLDHRAPIKIVGYDALSSGLFNHLMARSWAAIIADESTNIKRWQAQRTKRILKLAQTSNYKMIMTGTPMTGNLFDVWSQYKFIDGGETFGDSFWNFRQRYFAPAFFDWKPKLGTEAKIKQLINETSFRVLKKDCLDLPPKLRRRVPVDLHKEARKHYNTFVKDWLVTLPDGTEIDTRYVIQKMSYLARLCSGRLGDTKVPNNKLKKLEEVLKTIKERMSGVIIWCRYIDEVVDVIELCQKLKLNGVSFTDDDASGPPKKEFQNNPKCKVFVTTIRKGAKALTLTKASHAIYYGRDYDYMMRVQSEDRCHRIGSERHQRITYIDLFTKNTVEEWAIKAIKRKSLLASRVIPKSTIQQLMLPANLSTE